MAAVDQSVYATTGTSSIERGTTTGGTAPAGSDGATSATLAWTRDAARSGSEPTVKRAMMIPPEGWEVE